MVEFASGFLGLSVDAWIGIIGGAAAVLTFFFGEGILFAIGNAFNRGYRWEDGPVLDPNGRVVEVRVSQGYGDDRVLAKAYVAVVPRLPLKILWRLTHRHRVERFVTAARLLAPGTTLTLTLNAGVDLSGELFDEVPVPTWKLWKRNPQWPGPTTKRLVVLKFDRRRRLLSKKVKETAGGLKPPSRRAAVPVAHSAEAAEVATPAPAPQMLGVRERPDP